MVLSVVPPDWVDLEVTDVWFRWSTTWQCGVEIHLTIRNHGNAYSSSFDVTLEDHQEMVAGIPAGGDTTLIVAVSGEQIMGWMGVSGMLDVDNIIAERDESNNTYARTLPYSAVPGMESISYCYMSQTPPPSPTATPSHQTVFASETPTPTSTLSAEAISSLPNLKVLSIRNSFVPTYCWLEDDSNRHVVWIVVSNDGLQAIDGAILRFNDQMLTVGRLLPNATQQVEVAYDDSGQLQAEIDPLNYIMETDETDNQLETLVITFTPPATCTLTPTAAPT